MSLWENTKIYGYENVLHCHISTISVHWKEDGELESLKVLGEVEEKVCGGQRQGLMEKWKFHKARNGERGDPSKFAYCLSFLIISVMMLMHWNLESGRLKKQRGGVSAHKFSGHRPQLALWSKSLTILRRKKEREINGKKK